MRLMKNPKMFRIELNSSVGAATARGIARGNVFQREECRKVDVHAHRHVLANEYHSFFYRRDLSC